MTIFERDCCDHQDFSFYLLRYHSFVSSPYGGTCPRQEVPANRGGLFCMSAQTRTDVEFVTGRGGAGFHSPGPALTTGRGGCFGGDPRPAPVRGESPLIPWTGPRFSPPVLTGTRLGNGRGRGQGQGTLKKHAPPRAVQRGPRFSGPRRPRNEHYTDVLPYIFLILVCGYLLPGTSTAHKYCIFY